MRFFSLLVILLAGIFNVSGACNISDHVYLTFEQDSKHESISFISKSLPSDENESFHLVSGLSSNLISPFADFIEFNEYKEFKDDIKTGKSDFLTYKNHFSYSNHKTLKSFLYRLANNSGISTSVSKHILYQVFVI